MQFITKKIHCKGVIPAYLGIFLKARWEKVVETLLQKK